MTDSGYELVFGLVMFGPFVILGALVQYVIYALVASKLGLNGWKLHLAFLGVGLVGVHILLLGSFWLLYFLFGESLAGGPGVILWGVGTSVMALSILGWFVAEAVLVVASLWSFLVRWRTS